MSADHNLKFRDPMFVPNTTALVWITDQVANKQQKFIAHNSGGWKVQDQGASRCSIWWGSTFWFTDGHLLLYPHMAEGMKNLSEASFIRVLIPFTKDLSSWPNYRLKPSILNTLTLGLNFYIWIFGEYDQYIADTIKLFSNIRLVIHSFIPLIFLCFLLDAKLGGGKKKFRDE